MYINLLRKFPQTNYSIDLCFSISDYVVSLGVPISRTTPLLCSCVSSLSFWWFGWVASPPSPSDGLEELEPSPSNSPVTSRAAIADLVQLVSLLNCDKNYRFIIYLIIINNIVRKQIMQRTIEHALTTMSKGLPNFNMALSNFLQEEYRKEADNILEQKEACSSSFNLEKVENFSNKDIL